MSSEVLAPRSLSPVGPPAWTSVLAVIAHPDEASFGVGPVLDAFVFAGTRVEVLCLTHGQAWAVKEAPGDLATLRGAGLATADDVLGPARAKLSDCPDGALGEVCQKKLAADIVKTAESSYPDGLLVFDTAVSPGHLDHVAASSAALLAAERLDLPVLGWTFTESVAAQLNRELGDSFSGHRGEDVDLRVTLFRARQRVASHTWPSQALPGSAQRRPLDVLTDTGSLRWLRQKHGFSTPA